jgi:FKBP-type peptidyl-prolyl cis-trans isomerase 2
VISERSFTIAPAKIGDIVKINFTCRLEDGTVFDDSSGKEPLSFPIGQGQVMQGLDQAVIGMNQGESRTVKIPFDKAFGPAQSEKISVVGLDQFPGSIQPVVGMKFEIKREDGETSVVRITKVTDTTVTLDSNHPLAGKDLFFEIEVLEIVQTDISKADEYYYEGIALQDDNELDKAVQCYQKAIDLNPNHTGAYYNLGVSFQKQGQTEKAILYYEIAINLDQNLVEAHHNLGIAYKDKGQLDEAIICFQKVLLLQPDHANAYYNLGNTLVAKGAFTEAMQCYQKAVEINPEHADAHWSIGLIHLRLGNFEEGWKKYEKRWELKDVLTKPHFAQSEWDGRELKGRSILLYAEQGFGDTIQFIRYVPFVAEKGLNIIIECQKELVSLLRNTEGVSQVIAQGEQLPNFDVHCSLLSLPLIFGTTLETIPAEVPYINADAAAVQRWRNKIIADESALKIGLAWAGNPKLQYDHIRSCSLGTLSPLALHDSITFYSLQKGDASEQAKNPPEGFRLIDSSEDIKDFSDTAALIQNLDLIISVDTAVAHLAGALGKPVWTLLPFVPDWRWMQERKDSPWYPTMRLFRQPSRGDWESVILRIKDALKDLDQ